MSELNLQLKQIVGGNLLLIVCSIFYLLWWLAAFKPQRTASDLACGILLSIAGIVGLGGLFLAVRGLNTQQEIACKIPLGMIAVGGVAAYLILLLCTNVLCKRQVTTELLLIVGWAVLEFCIIDVMYSQNICSAGFAVAACILIVAVVIGSLACYLVYYHLDDAKRYVDGMIPLIATAVVMILITIRIVIKR